MHELDGDRPAAAQAPARVRRCVYTWQRRRVDGVEATSEPLDAAARESRPCTATPSIYHDYHKPWRTLRNAPPDVRDAARADRRAEDRITAGERVGERPQGFASRLRRARRAVLQEAAAPAPAFSVVVMACCVLSSFYPHLRRRRDRHGALC